MTFQKYRLHALTAELWRIHDEQDCKLGSYVWPMSCILQGSAMSKFYIKVIDQEWGQDCWILGSISTALSCQVRSAGSSPEQRLEIEPSWILAKYVFACLRTETKWASINSQKRTRPISSHLDRTSLVNKGFIIWLSGKFFLRVVPSGQIGSILPASYLARSDSQSQPTIWFILPAHGFSHIINVD